MPNCCVPLCKNSPAKGHLLKCFPKNERRRALWIKNINRPNWTPNHSHRVCEAHFAPSMWEKMRVDGSRKLKFNAVPTIFGDRTVEDPQNILQVKISPVTNNNETDKTKSLNDNALKNFLSNNQTLIKIIPPVNSTNSQATPIIIPAATILKAQTASPSGAIIVNSQGKIINSPSSPAISGGTSLLKSQVKMTNAQSSPMVISTNTSVLKNQIKVANSQTPIIIPSTTSILKSQVQNTNSQLNSINLNNNPQLKAKSTQPIVISLSTGINTSQVQNTNSTANSVSVDTDTHSETSPSTNQQTSVVKSTGIILNKIHAKKLEDERFEKMDKLLLKQLRLNNALRKKLSLVKNKLQKSVKEQNSDNKAFLKDVFTEDQIRVLELRHTNPKSITAWSHKTMIKAIKLKQECGTRGYQELLNQNMPLPSIRTICRWCTIRNIPIP